MEHIPGCAMGERAGELCPNPHELSDGKHHWWSGWPGAYCLGCFCEDPTEICLAGCECPCHAEFWQQYADAMNRQEDFERALNEQESSDKKTTDF